MSTKYTWLSAHAQALYFYCMCWRNNLISVTLDIANRTVIPDLLPYIRHSEFWCRYFLSPLWAEKHRGGSGLGVRGKKSSISLTPRFFLFFPIGFVKLRYEKLLLFWNGPKTLVNSKYQLKKKKQSTPCIYFSFLAHVIWRQKRVSERRWKKVRDVGFP